MGGDERGIALARGNKKPADDGGGWHSHESETRISAIADFARECKRKKKALPLFPRDRRRAAREAPPQHFVSAITEM
jgi:hypothetical protein